MFTKQRRKNFNACIKQMEAAISPDGYTVPKHGGVIRRGADPVTYFCFVGPKGEVRHSLNQACHAGLGYRSYYLEEGDDGNEVYDSYLTDIDMVVSRIQWENNEIGLPDGVAEAYMEWLTVDSPYAQVFLEKGGKRVVKRGYVALDTDFPDNLMAGAAFAHRMITEHFGSYAVLWHELVKRGVPANIAFAHSFQFSTFEQHGSVGINHEPSWHIPLSSSPTKEGISNFNMGRMVNPNDTYRETNTYDTVHDLWGGGAGYNLNSGYLYREAMEIFQQILDGTTSKAINPFKSGLIKGHTVPIEAFCDGWAELLKKEWNVE